MVSSDRGSASEDLGELLALTAPTDNQELVMITSRHGGLCRGLENQRYVQVSIICCLAGETLVDGHDGSEAATGASRQHQHGCADDVSVSALTQSMPGDHGTAQDSPRDQHDTAATATANNRVHQLFCCPITKVC